MASVAAPDQAICWVIAMAACVINTLLSGIGRATGIFYVALIEDYGVTREEANMPFTLRNCIRNLAGPIVGLLGQRYGVRVITVIGSVFATLGIVLCSVAPSVLWISVLWGGFHGIGVALANTLFQVTINQYFVKYRATAAGIALSGACLGSFVFPMALKMLLDTYGLPGAFLLTGGIIMHVLPASFLLTEPPWLKSKPDELASRKNEVNKKSLEVIREVNYGQENSNNSKNVIKTTKSIGTGNGIGTEKISSNSFSSLKKPDLKVINNFKKSGSDNPSFIGSTLDVKGQSKKQDSNALSLTKRSRTISAGDVSIIVPAEVENNSSKSNSLLKTVLNVYRNPMFHMISIALATFGILFDPLMTVIVDYVLDKGLHEDVGKYLISILSLGDLIGRLCFGWATDKNYISVPKFMLIIQLIQGSCMALFPLFSGFEMLMCLAVLYGLTAGTTIVMFPILVAKYLASEQSVAIGGIAFFGGLIAFSVPPLIGHFRDNEGSYDGMFYITGGMSVISGLLWSLEPLLVK